ncbi:MAG: hypothetical protein J6B75_06465 [Ruminococcus sp.]|nr:hypothetical protein [Ruminococcus sp.]
MWFIFFAALILTAACSIIFIKNFRKEMSKNLRLFAYGMTAVLLLTGLADIFFDFGSFGGAFEVMGAVAAIEAVLYGFLRKNASRTLVFMGKLLLTAAILELTFFQFPSYRLISGDYEHIVLPVADAELDGAEYDPELGGVQVKGTSEISLTYRELGHKVGTAYIQARFDGEKARQVNFFADMTEETGYYYRMKIIESKVIADSPQSQNAVVQLSGETSSARFRFSGVSENDVCVIESIELNRPVPFDVMPIRVILITVLGTFLYACIFSCTMQAKYCENRYFCRVSATWVTILAVCCGIILVLQQIPRGGFADRFKLTEGDQITEELVLAFEHGQFDLLSEPSEELLAMENPYDTGSRYYDDVECLWDHAFYNGKYYSYYGIAPLLLFVPYHLITGYFFPADIATMLFASGGLLLLSMLYTAVVRKWFGGISTGAYISGLAIILAACGVWYSVGRPMFYELSISAGFLCCTAGAYFLVTSGIFDKGQAKLPRILLSSLLLGLSVMCRPTLAVYAVCGCLFYLLSVKKQEKKWKYLACAFVPLMVLGAFQMYYNYARFGSIFEFGIKYSLTINDFTRTEFHLQNMLIGIYNFLLAPPAFIPDYPFVSTPFSFLGMNGYYFKDEGTISGVIFLALPIFGYFLSGRVMKRLTDRSLRIRAAVIGLTCIVMPFVIVCSVWESGYSARYMADFSWQVIIGAYAVLFFLFTRSENMLKKRIFTAVMGICCVYTAVVVGIEAYAFSFPQLTCPRYADILDRLLAFYR